MNDLHAEIMNLEPCESEADYYDSHHEATDSAYQKGFRDARHAAAELVSAALSAPPGFVLVPVEPTPEMVHRAMKECGGIGGGSCGEHVGVDWDDLRSVYAEMIAAAPSAKEPTP